MEDTNYHSACDPVHTWPATHVSQQLPDSARCECGRFTALEARTRRFVANEVAKRRMGPEARYKALEYELGRR